MKRAEWLRPFSFGNAIGFSSILTMESARDDWLLVHSHNGERSRRLALVHSHNGERSRRLASRPFSQWRERSAIGRGETDDPAPGSATETGDVQSSGVRRQNTNAVHATHILH